MRGFCGIGVVNSKASANIGTLWRSADAFGASFIFTVARRYSYQSTDNWKTPRRVPLFNFATIADLRAHLPMECRLVGVEIDEAAAMLPDFKHPEQACYLLGAEDHGLTTEARAACHHLVVIPGAHRCINVATAGSIVLYDRATRGTSC